MHVDLEDSFLVLTVDGIRSSPEISVGRELCSDVTHERLAADGVPFTFNQIVNHRLDGSTMDKDVRVEGQKVLGRDLTHTFKEDVA